MIGGGGRGRGGGGVVVAYAASQTTLLTYLKKVREKSREVPQSQTAALPRYQEEEKTDKSKQAQIEQTYEKY